MVSKRKGLTIRGNSVVMPFTYLGKRCRETCPKPTTKSGWKLLEQKHQTILFEISMGIFDYLKHFPNSKRGKMLLKSRADFYTIGDGLKDWFKRNESKYERSTVQGYKSAIFYHLIPQFGSLAIADLTAIQVKEWLASLKTLSNKRKNNILIPLRQLYEELYLDSFIEKNPLERIKNLPVSPREPEPFIRMEIEKILSQLEGQERNFFQFAFWSGLRTSELIALSWQDIDFENNRFYVRQAKVNGFLKGTKTSAGYRTVTLQPEAKQALLNQLAYTGTLQDVVFHDSRKNCPWKGDQVLRKTIWTPALKRAQVKYREPYQTRHTFASMLLSRGEEPMWVANQMGHKDWGMIRKTYGRWIPTNEPKGIRY